MLKPNTVAYVAWIALIGVALIYASSKGWLGAKAAVTTTTA